MLDVTSFYLMLERNVKVSAGALYVRLASVYVLQVRWWNVWRLRASIEVYRLGWEQIATVFTLNISATTVTCKHLEQLKKASTILHTWMKYNQNLHIVTQINIVCLFIAL